MTKHTPTLLDASSDLWRCIYFSENGFENKDFLQFYKIAKSTFDKNKRHLPKRRIVHIERQLEKALDKSLSKEHRREHLFTAAILLQ